MRRAPARESPAFAATWDNVMVRESRPKALITDRPLANDCRNASLPGLWRPAGRVFGVDALAVRFIPILLQSQCGRELTASARLPNVFAIKTNVRMANKYRQELGTGPRLALNRIKPTEEIVMTTYHTVFGSLGKYEKGTMEIINDNPKHYVFSNVFDVASKSKPYEKVALA